MTPSMPWTRSSKRSRSGPPRATWPVSATRRRRSRRGRSGRSLRGAFAWLSRRSTARTGGSSKRHSPRPCHRPGRAGDAGVSAARKVCDRKVADETIRGRRSTAPTSQELAATAPPSREDLRIHRTRARDLLLQVGAPTPETFGGCAVRPVSTGSVALRRSDRERSELGTAEGAASPAPVPDRGERWRRRKRGRHRVRPPWGSRLRRGAVALVASVAAVPGCLPRVSRHDRGRGGPALPRGDRRHGQPSPRMGRGAGGVGGAQDLLLTGQPARYGVPRGDADQR